MKYLFKPFSLLGKSNVTCADNEHLCESKNQCILKRLVCDGQIDCDDKSDESKCGKNCLVTIFLKNYNYG